MKCFKRDPKVYLARLTTNDAELKKNQNLKTKLIELLKKHSVTEIENEASLNPQDCLDILSDIHKVQGFHQILNDAGIKEVTSIPLFDCFLNSEQKATSKVLALVASLNIKNSDLNEKKQSKYFSAYESNANRTEEATFITKQLNVGYSKVSYGENQLMNFRLSYHEKTEEVLVIQNSPTINLPKTEVVSNIKDGDKIMHSVIQEEYLDNKDAEFSINIQAVNEKHFHEQQQPISKEKDQPQVNTKKGILLSKELESLAKMKTGKYMEVTHDSLKEVLAKFKDNSDLIKINTDLGLFIHKQDGIEMSATFDYSAFKNDPNKKNKPDYKITLQDLLNKQEYSKRELKHAKGLQEIVHDAIQSRLCKFLQKEGFSNEVQARIVNCFKNKSESLDLGNLNLKKLPPRKVFEFLKHLKSINCNNNSISQIGDELAGVSGPFTLSLSSNNVSQLEFIDKNGLIGLEKLFLSEYNFEKWPNFDLLMNLKILFINRVNQNSNLNENPPLNLPHLYNLSLENCNLSHIVNQFNCPVLTHLSLRENHLQKVELNVFDSLVKLKEIDS